MVLVIKNSKILASDTSANAAASLVVANVAYEAERMQRRPLALTASNCHHTTNSSKKRTHFTVMLGQPGRSRGLLGHCFSSVGGSNQCGGIKLGVFKKTG